MPSPELAEKKRSGTFILGYIGQLISRKGLDVLLRAVARLPQVPIEVYLIGEGDQGSELRRLAGELGLDERVHLLGYRADRLEWLRGFDGFVLPSRLEGIPRCLMEAMGAGVSVIASDIPGCRDLIEHGRTGLLFPVDDPAALADRIALLVADHGLRASLSAAAREHVEEHYSAARMAREYQLLYRNTCGAHDRAAETRR